MVEGVRIFVGDTLKIIDGCLYIITAKKPYRFGLDPNKEFPYGNWKKMLEEIDETPENNQDDGKSDGSSE
jgi:hypothetical protein